MMILFRLNTVVHVCIPGVFLSASNPFSTLGINTAKISDACSTVIVLRSNKDRVVPVWIGMSNQINREGE